MTENTDPATEVTTGNGELTYTRAMAEVEQILERLEGSAVDVDELSTNVERAVQLLGFCHERLAAVRADVGDVVTGLTAED